MKGFHSVLRAQRDRTTLIILTAAESRREEALAAGANRFATKPFSMEELEGEVAALLADGLLEPRTGGRRSVDDLLDQRG